MELMLLVIVKNVQIIYKIVVDVQTNSNFCNACYDGYKLMGNIFSTQYNNKLCYLFCKY